MPNRSHYADHLQCCDFLSDIIVRLQGTNADIAKKLIDNSGLDVMSATEFQEVADKVQAVLV